MEEVQEKGEIKDKREENEDSNLAMFKWFNTTEVTR